MTANEVALLSFLDGAPLAQAEQLSIRSYLSRAYTAHPAQLSAGTARVADAVAQLKQHVALQDALVRESYRAAIESLPPDDTERALVDRHDPVVAYQPSRQLIVTEHTIAVLLKATRWGGQALGAAPPDAAFERYVREELAARFKTYDRANQEAFAHVESNFAVAGPMLDHDPASRRRALLKWGAVKTSQDVIRDVTAALEYNAAKVKMAAGQGSGGQSGGQTRNSTLMRSLADRQMQQSVWSIRHPECGPMGNHPSSCSSAPVMNALPPPTP
jgi:hypothetical protein